MARLAATIGASIVALMAYVAYENLSISLDRSRQKRTMADMRSIATSLEVRATDRQWFPAPQTESFETMRPVPFHELERALVPVYTRRLPRVDGWGNPFEVRVGGQDAKARIQHYAVRSIGNDKHAESTNYRRGFITRFSEDIVFMDGSWIRAPEGM